MRLAALLGVAFALVATAPAAGAPEEPKARVQLGVLGEPGRFQQQTGQRSAVQHSFIGWHQPNTIPKLLGQLAPLPMLAIKTGGVVSPLDIAQGRGDAFLLALNSALAGFGQRVYVRPMPEMNATGTSTARSTRTAHREARATRPLPSGERLRGSRSSREVVR